MKEISVKHAYYLLLDKKYVGCIVNATGEEFTLLKTHYEKDYVTVNKNGIATNMLLSEIKLFKKPSPRIEKDRLEKELKEIERKKGYVYLLEDLVGLKIGMSNNPEKRFSSIKTGNSSVVLLKTIKVKDMKLEESNLHEKFKEFRYKGEWFYKADEIFNYFGVTSSFEPIVKKYDTELPNVIWNYIEEFNLETYTIGVCLRLNGVCDVYYRHRKVVDIVSNQGFYLESYEEMIATIKQIVEKHPKRDPIKKTKAGRMSYREFKLNQIQNE